MVKIFILLVKGERTLAQIEAYYGWRIFYCKLYLRLFRHVNFSVTLEVARKLTKFKQKKSNEIKRYNLLLRNNNISLR